MRGLLFFILYLLIFSSLNAQYLQSYSVWQGFNEFTDDLTIRTDEQQNIYVLGKNTQPFDLDFGIGVTNAAASGWFFAKYDRDFKLVYHRTFPSSYTITALTIEEKRVLLAYSYNNNNSSFAQVVSIDQETGNQINVFAFTAKLLARINSIAVDSRGIFYFAGVIGGNGTILTQVANQIGSGQNGVLIRYGSNSFQKNWFRRFTNLGFQGNNKDISAALVYLNHDNEIITIGNSSIATYVFEQNEIEYTSGGGFATKCDSTGIFSAMNGGIHVSGNADKVIRMGKIGNQVYLYDNNAIEYLTPQLAGNPIQLPFQKTGSDTISVHFFLANERLFYVLSGKGIQIENNVIKPKNNLTENHIMGELNAAGQLLWYYHMIPYKDMSSPRIIPLGENKVLFTAIINETVDLDPDAFKSVEIQPADGKRFFALYNVACSDLRLQFNQITNLDCDKDTALVEISLSSPRGIQGMKLDNVNQDVARRKFEFTTSGLHEWYVTDENCNMQKSVYIEGPAVEKTEPSVQLDLSTMRPGVASQMTLSVQSLNCENVEGTMVVTFPDIFENIEISLPHQWLSDTVAEIETPPITYSETFNTSIPCQIKANTPEGTPFCVKASFVSENETVNSVFCGEVKNSEVANDMMSFPGGRCEQHYVLAEEVLEYLIHFQNTGNDSAFAVTILDNLDEGLDVSGFRLLQSSHPVQVTSYGQLLKFGFNDINLQAQSTDEALSKGFVRFTVPQKAGNAPGIQYTNKAHIIFDYNDAITTGTVFNTLTDVLPSCVVVNTSDGPLSNIRAYPNPVNQLLYLDGNKSTVAATLFSTTGQVIWDRHISLPSTLNLEGTANGTYLLKIRDGENSNWIQLIIAH